MDTRTLRQILIAEMEKYAGEGLNAVSYLMQNATEDIYTVVDIATVRGKRIIGNVLVARLYEGKIIIELDHNNKPLVDALTASGIPEDRIILAYQDHTITA